MGETLAGISRLVERSIGVLQICIHVNRMQETQGLWYLGSCDQASAA
jgi:hypothetical protein